ncbi:mitochondrial ribosomal protein S31 [Xylocopa sonorina]|uniref:mitochondrial ribosomal protein S31 n=1 Tax=Xylocopa sonorina TaxID=1818115 RepID=UPI00403A9516
MIAIHLFPKNIKTPIVLPYQWFNLTFNIIRSNLSTTSDSSSSSDSDSDSDNPKSSTKKYKKINYLNTAKIAQKKREIEKQLTKTAQLLTLTSGKDKEEILSGLLDTIMKIQNEDTNSLVKSNKSQNEVESNKKYIENIDEEKYQKDDLFTIKMQKGRKRRTRYNDHKFGTKVDMPKEQSIISMLKRQGEETKVDMSEGQSIISMLKRQGEETKVDMSEGQSIISMLKRQEEEKKVDMSEGQSIISMLKRQGEETKVASPELSVTRTLLNEQKISRDVYDKFDARHDELYRWKMPQTQAMETKYIDKFKAKHKGSVDSELQTESSVIEMLKHQLQQKNGYIKEKRTTEWDKQHVKYENIFDSKFLDSSDVPELKIWNSCEEKVLKSIVTQYPENAFHEMIEWTNQGKVWKFPIDNEQGMEMEQNVHFSKHVFLERHLSPWCPAKGPIRHFMELVCIGLSKNPYMTFDEKYDHIMWYKDYFSGKKDLLQKLGLEIA